MNKPVNIRCICVDDEALARKGLRRHLNKFNNIELIGEFADGDELLNNLVTDVDVIFLDIEMPRRNGFELLKHLPKPLPIIIFVTAYDHYAIQAFEYQALDYVLKPIDEARFQQVIARIRTLVNQKMQQHSSVQLIEKIQQLEGQIQQPEPEISVKTDEGYFQVKLNELLYLEAAGDHVALHFSHSQLLTRATLKTYQEQLVAHEFRQIHKSYLVNMNKIKQVSKARFGDFNLTLSNDVQLRVSRTYKAAICRLINK